MAIVGLSEFTFGYGFLYEQTQRHWGNLRIAPILPSLTREADDAWDARLPLVGTDFYYQFKLSDYLERRNSLFHRDGTYSKPYYRFSFHRRHNNRQHHRLWQHAQTNPNTFYVTPEFSTIEDFNTAFLEHRLADHTRIIPLNRCDDCDDGEQHYITFRPGATRWTQHSKPKRKTGSYQGKDVQRLYESSKKDWQPIDEKFAEAALDRTTTAVRRALERDKATHRLAVKQAEPLLEYQGDARGRGALLRKTAEILSAFVGASMVLVGEVAG